jgi:hypothetical protein
MQRRSAVVLLASFRGHFLRATEKLPPSVDKYLAISFEAFPTFAPMRRQYVLCELIVALSKKKNEKETGQFYLLRHPFPTQSQNSFACSQSVSPHHSGSRFVKQAVEICVEVGTTQQTAGRYNSLGWGIERSNSS